MECIFILMGEMQGSVRSGVIGMGESGSGVDMVVKY